MNNSEFEAKVNMHTSLREANERRQAEWDSDNQLSLTFRATELAGEVGEACNIIKKLERERLGIRGSRATLEELAEELADVVIATDLIAMHLGIDLLGKAVPAKFNKTSTKNGLMTRMVELSTLTARMAELKTRKKEEPAFCHRCNGTGQYLMQGDLHRSEGWVPCGCGAGQ